MFISDLQSKLKLGRVHEVQKVESRSP